MSVVLPSAWVYLEPFGVKLWFCSLVLSAECFGSASTSWLTGKISDMLVNKDILITHACVWLAILGNTLYAIPVSPYFPLIGRFVCGIGLGGMSVLIAVVAKSTNSQEEFRKMNIFLNGICSIGLVIGPNCNLFLEKFDFSVGPLKVDRGNAPGFFMAIIFILVDLLIWLLARESDHKNHEYEKVDTTDPKSKEEEGNVKVTKDTELRFVHIIPHFYYLKENEYAQTVV